MSFTAPSDTCRLIGSFVAPHADGDFEVGVYDLKNWATGSCMIRQQGQGQTSDIVVTVDEAEKLATLLLSFAVDSRG